jgi:hypothetical protein
VAEAPAQASTWAEAAVAVRLGAAPDVAAAAVRALADAGLLTHGVAVAAAALAARWGVDLPDALAALAAGRAPHGTLSDYELRTGRAEAEDALRGGGGAPSGRVTGAGDAADWTALLGPDRAVPASSHHLRADGADR